MIRTRQGESDLPLGAGIPLPEEGDVRLQVCTRKETAHFFYAVRPGPLTAIGPELDATLLSDDAYEEIGPNALYRRLFGYILYRPGPL